MCRSLTSINSGWIPNPISSPSPLSFTRRRQHILDGARGHCTLSVNDEFEPFRTDQLDGVGNGAFCSQIESRHDVKMEKYGGFLILN